jgi:hypothetical protein
MEILLLIVSTRMRRLILPKGPTVGQVVKGGALYGTPE